MLFFTLNADNLTGRRCRSFTRKMKTHAIIPIFIPHKGCPNDCVFCNQRKITARTADVTPSDARKIIEEWLSTLSEVETVEVAFYGGSFTGIPMEEQTSFLEVAESYKEAGRISKIHLSTRPDYIDEKILDNLKAHSVDVIELGVQSFDDKVLKLSNRGHDSACVYRACELIHNYGFELGIQLMIGLPGDSMDACLYSARETVKLHPSLARLYPTIVIDDTELYEQYKRGEYVPLSREEAILRTKEMYKILDDAGITIMRVGLKSTDIIGDGGAVNGGTYHPAFRQLVEGRIARERIEEQLDELLNKRGGYASHELRAFSMARGDSGTQAPANLNNSEGFGKCVEIYSSPSWFSNMIGHQAENKKYFSGKYPDLSFSYKEDTALKPGKFRIKIKTHNF